MYKIGFPVVLVVDINLKMAEEEEVNESNQNFSRTILDAEIECEPLLVIGGRKDDIEDVPCTMLIGVETLGWKLNDDGASLTSSLL